MDGEIDTTTNSRRLSLDEILDVNTHSGECPSMVCRNKKLHSHRLVTSYLQDFNMVKIQSRPQTELNRINCDTSEIMSTIERSFILVAKAIVVRKSLGQKCPCGFESRLSHNKTIIYIKVCGGFCFCGTVFAIIKPKQKITLWTTST